MFDYLTKESAPVESLPQIERSLQTYGFLPKLHAVMANAPAAYQAYLDNFALFESATTLSPLEQQIVFQTSNYENRCHYCIPGHIYILKTAGMPEDIIEALREGKPLPDPRLDALRTFTRQLIDLRGHLSDEQLNTFIAAGYTPRQALEVLVGLAAKLISNFVNAMAGTELDGPVQQYTWTHPDQR